MAGGKKGKIEGGIMKRSDIQRGPVCIICGKPSQKRICEACTVTVEAEAIHHKLESAKSEKHPD